ncbi:MAG: hypothetical protein A2749_02950 [Parcubacteria group bacterium RIFCSPHIGHO2_01_FULL_45_26]|nr:MAG: hypothetical protein A2749_02950 [Parcubacteria group bacterium RIFCSPHIGHO2_01_FULL_45_26]
MKVVLQMAITANGMVADPKGESPFISSLFALAKSFTRNSNCLRSKSFHQTEFNSITKFCNFSDVVQLIQRSYL